MINTWWLNLFLYLILYVVFTQSYKVATQSSKDDGALVVLLEFLSGVMVLLLAPLFRLQFPSNYMIWVLLGIACVFYAITDRITVTVISGLDISTYSILEQLSTVFLVMWGIIFFKEEIILKKIIGAILILIGNIIVLYKKGKLKFNKYIIYSIIGSLTVSVALSVDVGISDEFNIPIYVALTLIVPCLMIFLANRIKISNVISEFKRCNKKAMLLVSVSWGTMVVALLRAYQFGSITTIAPIDSTTTILNVFAAYFLLKEKDSLMKKILAALIAILGIVLINI